MNDIFKNNEKSKDKTPIYVLRPQPTFTRPQRPVQRPTPFVPRPVVSSTPVRTPAPAPVPAPAPAGFITVRQCGSTPCTGTPPPPTRY